MRLRIITAPTPRQIEEGFNNWFATGTEIVSTHYAETTEGCTLLIFYK